MNLKLLLTCAFLILCMPYAAFAQKVLDVKLVANRPLSTDAYLYRVLDLALSNQPAPYVLAIEVIEASEPRRKEIVQSSTDDYVITLGNRLEYEADLQAVYIPIQLGLGIGRRIILTRQELLGELEQVKSVEDLAQFSIGQGLGWTDVRILRDAGLNVVTLANSRSIPKMITAKRLDLYPRGLFEIDREYERYLPENPGLVIDDHLMLTYTLASYFYVRPGNERLHSAIRQGLDTAYATGQLQDLIMTDPVLSKSLHRLNKENRINLILPNNHASENH